MEEKPLKKIFLSAAAILALLCLLTGCSKNPLVGKWVSDVACGTVICFLDNERLTVTTGDTVLDGVYYTANDTITITLNSPVTSYTVTAKYEITDNNKLILTSEDGKKEQFSQK